MPHVIVKLWPGKADDQKRRLADAITQNVTNIFEYGEDTVSVAFQEVQPNDWAEQVYGPDILGKWNDLAKQPGYGPRPSEQRHGDHGSAAIVRTRPLFSLVHARRCGPAYYRG